MTERINGRLQELRTELEAGHRLMTDLQARQANLQSSMLRISGAIQVLEELLQAESAAAPERVAAQPVMTN